MLALLAWIEPIITAHEPVVLGPPPPPPPPAGLGVLPFVLMALSFAWWLARRWSRPGTKRAARVAAFGMAIGNALVDIAAMLQPDRPTAAEFQRVREEPAQRERDKRKARGIDPGGVRSRARRFSRSAASATVSRG